jgi:hypothetical protein
MATISTAPTITPRKKTPATRAANWRPISANLHLCYRRDKQMQNAVIALTRNADTWSATWDSSVADQCQVDWHVRSTGSDVAGLQGSFRLEVNRANPTV